MKLIKYATVIVSLAMVAMLASCEYDNPVPEKEIPEIVSFSNDLIPYFDKSCNMSGCHNDFGIPPVLTAAKAYDALQKGQYIDLNTPENSRLYKKIIPGGSMEPYSTAQENEIVLKWIQQGAENN